MLVPRVIVSYNVIIEIDVIDFKKSYVVITLYNSL